jgi:protein MpaA
VSPRSAAILVTALLGSCTHALIPERPTPARRSVHDDRLGPGRRPLEQRHDALRIGSPAPAAGAALCRRLQGVVDKHRWNMAACPDGVAWRQVGVSALGEPLLIAELGAIDAPVSVLVLSMVHPDEMTPLHATLVLLNRLVHTPPPDVRVVVAPLVNPDGLWREEPSRSNARGVDLNRNFPASDWAPTRRLPWKGKLIADLRRFPGDRPATEPETLFQMALVTMLRPHRIVSLHAPWGLLDYDGPEAGRERASLARDAMRTFMRIRKRPRAHSRVSGSLGSWAGRDHGIPCYTVELPSSHPYDGPRFTPAFLAAFEVLVAP